MLNEEICKRCVCETKIDDEDVWEVPSCWCPYADQNDVDEYNFPIKVPINCPYRLEHLLENQKC